MTEAGGWRCPDDGAAVAELARDLPTRGRVRLERGGHEFALIAEAQHDRAGKVNEVRVVLRRSGGAFVGPRGSFPALGSIVDSMSFTVSSPVVSLQRLSGSDRARVCQTAVALLERAGRRLDVT